MSEKQFNSPPNRPKEKARRYNIYNSSPEFTQIRALAEFERGIIKERVNAGLAAAKARGVQLGPPATINGRAAEIRKLKAKGLGLRAIARKLKMPPSSVLKALQLAA